MTVAEYARARPVQAAIVNLGRREPDADPAGQLGLFPEQRHPTGDVQC